MQNRHIAALLPDQPRWVEVRALLLNGRGEVLSFRERAPLSFLLRDPDDDLLAVVGPAENGCIRFAAETLRPGAEVICAPEDADAVAAALPG